MSPDARRLKFNVSLWKYFPVGFIAGVWDSFESLRSYLTADEKILLTQVLEAMNALDQAVRDRLYKRHQKGGKRGPPKRAASTARARAARAARAHRRS